MEQIIHSIENPKKLLTMFHMFLKNPIKLREKYSDINVLSLLEMATSINDYIEEYDYRFKKLLYSYNGANENESEKITQQFIIINNERTKLKRFRSNLLSITSPIELIKSIKIFIDEYIKKNDDQLKRLFNSFKKIDKKISEENERLVKQIIKRNEERLKLVAHRSNLDNLCSNLGNIEINNLAQKIEDKLADFSNKGYSNWNSFPIIGWVMFFAFHGFRKQPKTMSLLLDVCNKQSKYKTINNFKNDLSSVFTKNHALDHKPWLRDKKLQKCYEEIEKLFTVAVT